jgi:hypothetical protein
MDSSDSDLKDSEQQAHIVRKSTSMQIELPFDRPHSVGILMRCAKFIINIRNSLYMDIMSLEEEA